MKPSAMLHRALCGRSRLALLPALVAALAAGCAGQPTRYYTLAVPTVAQAASAPNVARAEPLAIEVAQVAVPERLARPQLVVFRKGDGAEVRLLERNRWVSSFDNELRDAIGSGVAARLGAVDLSHGGRRSAQPVWRIAVQVQQFDATEDTRLDAAFTWSLRRADGEAGPVCAWHTAEPLGAGIPAVADGAQRVAAQLAERIARHLAALQRQPDAGCPA